VGFAALWGAKDDNSLPKGNLGKGDVPQVPAWLIVAFPWRKQ